MGFLFLPSGETSGTLARFCWCSTGCRRPSWKGQEGWAHQIEYFFEESRRLGLEDASLLRGWITGFKVNSNLRGGLTLKERREDEEAWKKNTRALGCLSAFGPLLISRLREHPWECRPPLSLRATDEHRQWIHSREQLRPECHLSDMTQIWATSGSTPPWLLRMLLL